MRVTVKKWGNSASVRIPASIMEAAQLSLDQTVEIREEAGQIIIDPVRAPAYELEDLLSGITEDNVHEEVSSGPPSGRESL